MQDQIRRDAHAVLLPAITGLTLTDPLKRFLAAGGCSVLLGETREEYVAREMSAHRRTAETGDHFLTLRNEASSHCGDLIVAVDQEIGGIRRLHDLVPGYFAGDDWRTDDDARIEQQAQALGKAAAALGVNCFLAPVLDAVTGTNPWLARGRSISPVAAEVARVSSAYIRGVQSGGVAATAKHFPGHHDIPLDPAVNDAAEALGARDGFIPGFAPFRAAIKCGVEIVMMGPAKVPAFDAHNPASLSPALIDLLRLEFGFEGIVLSDGLEASATIRSKSLPETAVAALAAGCDALLLSAGEHLEDVTDAICRAVDAGILPEERLHASAGKVRALAARYV